MVTRELDRTTGGASSAPLIVGIGGTTRPSSTSEMALHAMLNRMRERGAICQAFCADQINLPMYDPQDPGRSREAAELVQAVRAADCVVVSSPGYHGGLSGMLKNALDYLQDLAADEPPYLHERAVGCITSAYGWQAAVMAMASLRTTVHALRGWPTPLGVVINSSRTTFLDGVASDPKINDQLDTMADQLMWFARSRAAVFSATV